MGVDTHGKIKGFVSHEEITNYIREKWDKNVYDGVEKQIYCPLSELKNPYKINEHSDDDKNWYITHGFIRFNYNKEDRMLFYHYSNVNNLENLDYYCEHGLKNMIESETTYVSLGYNGSSVEIIKEIVAHFGGGWIDENDCDDKEYCAIGLNTDETIGISKSHYGLCDPEKEKFSEELLRYGEVKANSEILEIDGTIIRIRCIRYKGKIWFHHMEDGEILEIFEM